MMARGAILPYQLAGGTQRWMVKFRTSNGVQKLKRGFKGPREAEAYLNQVMGAVDRGEVVSGSDTFAQYIDRWLEEHRPRLEEGTYRDYQVHIEQRLKPFFGDMKLSSIAPADVRRYVAELVRGLRRSASASSRSRTLPENSMSAKRALARSWEGLSGRDRSRARRARSRAGLPGAVDGSLRSSVSA